mgnify:CR=1 FL=1
MSSNSGSSVAGNLYNVPGRGWLFPLCQDPDKGGACVVWAVKVPTCTDIAQGAQLRVRSYMPFMFTNSNTSFQDQDCQIPNSFSLKAGFSAN